MCCACAPSAIPTPRSRSVPAWTPRRWTTACTGPERSCGSGRQLSEGGHLYENPHHLRLLRRQGDLHRFRHRLPRQKLWEHLLLHQLRGLCGRPRWDKKAPWDAGQRRPAEQAPGGPHLCPHGEKRRGKREDFLTEFHYFAVFSSGSGSDVGGSTVLVFVEFPLRSTYTHFMEYCLSTAFPMFLMYSSSSDCARC